MPEPITTPVVWLAIDPKTDGDREKLNRGLQQLMKEDPTFRVQTDQQTGQIAVGALGELQLEIIVDRLFREFNVGASVGRPQVAYKQTFTRAAEGDGRYVQQTDGRGPYGHVRIRVLPGEAGSGYVFDNRISGGAIPHQFIKPIDEGIQEACSRGVFSGYPIDDVRIELYDGSYHDRDSSEMAFRVAGSMALLDAAKRAGPVLLEPIMRVEVIVTRDHIADVIGDLAGRRGAIQSLEDSGGNQIIRALVPSAEMFGYFTDLQFRTRGHGTFSLRFDSYQQVRVGPNTNDDDRDSLVGAPLKPLPTLNESGVALPEPDDDGLAI